MRRPAYATKRHRQNPKRDIIMVIGDFNAKVGHHKGGDGDTIGGHGLGIQNEAGEGLVEFFNGNNLGIMNTWFEQPKRRLYTWTSPDGKHRNQIDYILINKRRKSMIRDVRIKPDADCGTDHELLVATLKTKLKKTGDRMKVYDCKGITPTTMQGSAAQRLLLILHLHTLIPAWIVLQWNRTCLH